MKIEKGILGEPERKQCKPLLETTVALVKEFYDNDEVLRMMPGKKDFVSLGNKQHGKRRLLLCNLVELYTEFKSRFPGVKI